MATELLVLALGAVLLIVHVLAAVHYKTRQFGLEWNMGARDEDKGELDDIAGRLERASANFRETFPVAIVVFAGLVLAEKTTGLTAIAAWVWLGARVVYLPVYWAGIAKIRTAIWAVSLLALIAALGVLLFG
ncbi:MAG: MAPEG family protein [Erythrobacter sp.]|jgi:uncharacterized MAPEG superfamily protein|nr:MAPEG family protein [Erythrobacter sp.]